MIEGSEFFDKVADRVEAHRGRTDTPNETLERPVFFELLGDVVGKRVLDLGCGDGATGVELLEAGCTSYVGIDSSESCIRLARMSLPAGSSEAHRTTIEQWNYQPDAFDIVISRLALHYVEDLDRTFSDVFGTLVPGGRFVFSMVHPVITSCDRSRQQTGGGQRQDWIVDDYFLNGPREVLFFRETVVQFHRTVEDVFASLKKAGLRIDELRESRPMPGNFEDKDLFQRRSRIPLFLFFAASK